MCWCVARRFTDKTLSFINGNSNVITKNLERFCVLNTSSCAISSHTLRIFADWGLNATNRGWILLNEFCRFELDIYSCHMTFYCLDASTTYPRTSIYQDNFGTVLGYDVNYLYSDFHISPFYRNSYLNYCACFVPCYTHRWQVSSAASKLILVCGVLINHLIPRYPPFAKMFVSHIHVYFFELNSDSRSIMY